MGYRLASLIAVLLLCGSVQAGVPVRLDDERQVVESRQNEVSEKLDEASRLYVVPLFKVNPNPPTYSPTTLIAIRNEEFSVSQVSILYIDEHGNAMNLSSAATLRELQIKQVWTLNLARVFEGSNIPTGTDGLIRGRLMISGTVNNDLNNPALLTVDSMQVDFANNFATGDNAVAVSVPGSVTTAVRDLCETWRIRFLKFPGPGGTKLTIYTPVATSWTSTAYNESGIPQGSFHFEADPDQRTLEIDAKSLLPPNSEVFFGSIDIDFGGLGFVSAEHSAFDKFSVGSRGHCLPPNF